MNEILLEDLEDIAKRGEEHCASFRGKVFLITGATGLIGSLLVRSLYKINEKYDLGLQVVALVRNKEKARAMFGDLDVKVVTSGEEVSGAVNYVIHCAAPTQSQFFIEKPVETMDAIILGTKEMLDLAKEKQVEKFLYISSMEAYGTIEKEQLVKEDDAGRVALNKTRSSYPLAKRTAELYTYCYSDEYDVNVSIVRLAMCFGAGLGKDDHRVHKSFCEDALNGRDIVVKSSGETIVNFVYSADAVIALLMLLVKGKNKETYNVAGDNNGLTIYNMAKYVAELGGVEVRKELPQGVSAFAPENKMKLDVSKIRGIGWQPKYDLVKALERLMDYLRDENY